MVTVSVPGKIHLMGEHAVVYGYPALLCAIDRRLHVSIESRSSGEGGIHIDTPIGKNHVTYAVNYLLEKLHIQSPPSSTLTIKSDIPAGFHLGSSAAMAVGITGAIMFFYKKIWNPIRINELAYEIEKKQHGNPSGGDNTVVTMGGFIWYRRELEFLKSIWQLPFRPHASLSHFMLINTGRPKESTGDMVSHVAASVSADEKKMHEYFAINEKMVRQLTLALKQGDEPSLIESLKLGEETLEHIGVVSPAVKPCIREIEQNGGAVKILGGGGLAKGVGYMLCYHHDSDAVSRIIAPYGYTLEHTTLGEEGVRLDEK